RSMRLLGGTSLRYCDSEGTPTTPLFRVPRAADRVALDLTVKPEPSIGRVGRELDLELSARHPTLKQLWTRCHPTNAKA
ncbi:MAG: hypothetical protein OEZ42_16220, partial [Gemmatimonadota bacterium]|nr:hypothetical protein [Gemmatimonadota bacterium]